MRSYYKIVIPVILSILLIVNFFPFKLSAVDISTVSDIGFQGSASGEYNGLRLLEDVNGDNIPDIINYQYSSNGSVFIVFGASTPVLGDRPFGTASSFNLRINGGVADSINNVYASDVNGDGMKDLILTSGSSNYGGSGAGSIYVIFSTLLDNFGTSTGNVLSLDTSTNYNIRYDGDVNYQLDTITEGDINSDGNTDLIISALGTTFGGPNSGSVFVILSTLVDNYSTTGNNLSIATGGNYNIRYDSRTGAATGIAQKAVGDVNGDGLNDFAIGAYQSSISNPNGGEAFVLFSALITAYGSTTGNN